MSGELSLSTQWLKFPDFPWGYKGKTTFKQDVPILIINKVPFFILDGNKAAEGIGILSGKTKKGHVIVLGSMSADYRIKVSARKAVLLGDIYIRSGDLRVEAEEGTIYMGTKVKCGDGKPPPLLGERDIKVEIAPEKKAEILAHIKKALKLVNEKAPLPQVQKLRADATAEVIEALIKCYAILVPPKSPFIDQGEALEYFGIPLDSPK